MASIIRFDNSCKIVDEDSEEVFRDLDNELSFKIQGAEFSAAYKGYFNDAGEFITWDGKRHLLASNGKFPVGLLPRVQEFFDKRGKIINIIDKRAPKIKSPSIDILGNLKSMNKVPRPYQIMAAETATDTDRGIIRIGTGGGKSLVAALIVASIGKPAVILVIGRGLLYQFHEFFTKVFQQEIGIIGDGKCEIHDLNIGTVWSIGQVLGIKKNLSDDDSDSEKKLDTSKFSRIKEMLLNSSTIILDECHLAACDTVQIISRNIKAEYVFGMSASPWRDDNATIMIEAFLGKNIVDIGAKELIKQGYLVEPKIRFLAPKAYPYKSGAYPKIYSKYIIENEQRNGMIFTGAKRLVEQGFVPLVLFNSIKHGEILFDGLKNIVPCALLSGKDKTKVRDKTMNDLESGKIKALVASKIMDIGLDAPILSALVVGAPTKSSVRSLQRVGRILRIYPGKKIAPVIDFADQAPYLSDHADLRRKIYSSEFDVEWPIGKREIG